MKKLNEITELISDCEDHDIGLLNGLSGINIALFHLKNNSNDKIISNIEKIITEINNGNSSLTYCDGIAGFAWSLLYLIDRGVLNKKDCKILLQMNDILYHKMRVDIENKQIDFLHGAIGIGLYFNFNKFNKLSLKNVKELINKIDELKIEKQQDVINWESVIYNSNKQPELVSNTGLSHGIASIIAFLTKAYQNEINISKSKQLMVGAINYLLKCQNNIKKYNCYFPNFVENDNYSLHSRMAWCYGDLGISVALYNAAKVIGDHSLEEFAIKVLKHSTKRRSLVEDFVNDAGLCHGAAGIAHIYYRMFWNTKDQSFKEAAAFWYEKTLEMSSYSDGLAGFKAWREHKGGLVNDYGILEGISGIGLTLHSWVTQTEPTWDECLLLS